MSAFSPRRYQLLAINAILEQVVAGLSAHREDPSLPPRRVRLKAPTGSGKTAILSTVLRRLATEETSFDLAGIWIAPGRLHEQAFASAQQIVEGAISPTLRNGIGTTISQNQILFVNWESLNREEANNFRKENERGEYLQAIVANARAVGRVLVVVIDESHRNIGTAPSMDVLEEIAPAVVIEMSATIGNATYEVGRAAVVAEGMIRSEVVANLGVTEGMAADHRLDLALGKRREILEAYARRGSNVNPLLIIQIPNGTRGDAELSSLRTELGHRGITELSDRRRMADWWSGYPTRRA